MTMTANSNMLWPSLPAVEVRRVALAPAIQTSVAAAVPPLLNAAPRHGLRINSWRTDRRALR